MVPKGWTRSNLEEYVDIRHGFAFKSEYFATGGRYVLMTPGHFHEAGGFRDQGEKTKYYVEEIPKGYLLEKGDVVLAMTEQASGLLGSAAYVPEDNKYLHNQRLGLLKVKDPRKVCLEFLYLTYNSPVIRKQISEQASGTKVKHTSPGKLKGVVTLLPPLPEQKKIAQILSTWDKAITTTEQLLANSQQQKKALMQQLLTGKRRLPEFDGEWKLCAIGDWLEEQKVKSSTQDQHVVLTSSRSGLIRQSDYFGDGRIVRRDNTGFTVIPPGYLTYRSRSDDGMFVFNKNDLGVTGIVSSYYPVFRFPEGDDNFFTEALNFYSRRFSGVSVGTSQKVLSLGALTSIRLRLPAAAEQRAIASVIKNADRLACWCKGAVEVLNQEKKALMQQLLTGKRRVAVE